MTEDYFHENVICCNMCGNEPIIIRQIREELFSRKQPVERYVCKCTQDDYMGYKSGYCKTPEAALRSWNNKMTNDPNFM